MIPINNSDTAWLIVTDYNQDNSLPYEDLRNDIISPDVNQWTSEYIDEKVGGSKIYNDNEVGCGFNGATVGSLDTRGAESVGGVGSNVVGSGGQWFAGEHR